MSISKLITKYLFKQSNTSSNPIQQEIDNLNKDLLSINKSHKESINELSKIVSNMKLITNN